MRISLTVGKLVRVLQRLAPLDAESIASCLSEESSNWEKLSILSANLEELKEECLGSETVAAFHREMTAGEEVVVSLESMLGLSQVMAREVEDYRHSEYQAAMAAVITSRPGKVTVAVAPTGSGKTWVQGLVAKHFCRLGQKVVVVEPTDALMQQAAEKLALVDYGITVTTMKRLYEEGPWTDVIILDEYDTIVEKCAYLV